MTPQERIETAIKELNHSLKEELLEHILQLDPASFAKLILLLMRGVRYGGQGSGEHLGRTGNGGVDEVVNEDALGLEFIYPQAKRYRPDNNVGVQDIRGFGGALDEVHASKGVFVTTSKFSPSA